MTAVEELLSGDAEQPPELLGARLPELDLSGTTLDHGVTPIDFRDATVAGDLRLEYTESRSPLRLARAELAGDLVLDSIALLKMADGNGITPE